MAKNQKIRRPLARLPKGFRDVGSEELRLTNRMLTAIGEIYESYGFEPLETPAFEYSDALGKFLPDADRPNDGVFSIVDDDDQWMSLRYDLTAPLARHVAEHYQNLPKPYRRYSYGTVWRNEKPGPGRFRQFLQFDADTVGTANVAADAEICMLMAETMERLGFERGQYIVRVNNRKILDGVLMRMGLNHETPGCDAQRLVVLRALDKLDRLGSEGVRQLLGTGRRDESGDYTVGAGLEANAIEIAMAFLGSGLTTRPETINSLKALVEPYEEGLEGIAELQAIHDLLIAADMDEEQVVFDPSVVRGLDYYTGPVFETELTFETKNDRGEPIRFGSVGGGGRY
ncbi:MAG: histidine--tRNA ligase, partial [Hyphomicrobiaceae bacterium]